jgi:hypothetical protein
MRATADAVTPVGEALTVAAASHVVQVEDSTVVAASHAVQVAGSTVVAALHAVQVADSTVVAALHAVQVADSTVAAVADPTVQVAEDSTEVVGTVEAVDMVAVDTGNSGVMRSPIR